MRTLIKMFSKALFAFVLMTAISMNTATGNQSDQLAAAAKDGNFELVKQLIEQGADVNAKGNYGIHALIWAAWGGIEKS